MPQQHYHQTNATTAARAGRRADKSEIQPAVWQQRNPRAAQYDFGEDCALHETGLLKFCTNVGV